MVMKVVKLVDGCMPAPGGLKVVKLVDGDALDVSYADRFAYGSGANLWMATVWTPHDAGA
jgi:hypothetical protein